MPDVLGFPVHKALAQLEAHEPHKSVRIIETSGYKASDDMSNYTDARAIGIRSLEFETVLIIAKF